MKKFYFSIFIFLLILGERYLAKPGNINIYKTTKAPVIDGTQDAVDSLPIEKPLDVSCKLEVPTIPNGDWWKAMWCNTTFFVLVYVGVENFYPSYANT